MPSLPEVQPWNTTVLSDASTRTSTADARFVDELGGISRSMERLHENWSGSIYDADRDGLIRNTLPNSLFRQSSAIWP